METLTDVIKRVEATDGKGSQENIWNYPITYADSSEPSYGKDGRAEALMHKRFRDIPLKNTRLGDYLTSRLWAAESWTGKAFEFITVPIRAVRFAYCKYIFSSA